MAINNGSHFGCSAFGPVHCVLLGLIVAGCAAGPQRSTTSDQGGLSARQLRRCTAENFPQQLPPAAALVDTAALTRAVRELRVGAAADSGTVLLSLGFEPDGLNVRRDVLRHTLSPLVADSIQKLVFAHRRTAPATEQPWGARLRIGLGGAVSYTVERREYCPPRPRDREVESAMEEFMGTGLRSRAGRLERTVLLRVLVHPGGYVSDARVIRGEASGGTLERDLKDFIRRYMFEPASLDGMPVPGHIDVPVRVRA